MKPSPKADFRPRELGHKMVPASDIGDEKTEQVCVESMTGCI